MVSEVCKCIGNVIYNEELIQCFRGIGVEDKFVFNDESSLKSFSLFFDERRREDEIIYELVRNDILEYLENVWYVEKNFKGCYSEDYRILISLKTACIDKYSVFIFRENEDWRLGKFLERFDRQFFLDYERWKESGEFYYFSYEVRRDFLRGFWDECFGLFFLEKILEFVFRVLFFFLEEELKVIVYLVWIIVNEVLQFYVKA